MHAFVTGLLLAAAPALPAQSAPAPAPAPAATAPLCAIAAPCARPLPVRMVVVTMFEIGKDEGDTAGEFQLWKTRRNLHQRIPFPHGFHDIYYNPETQILGIVTGVGSIRSAAAVTALGLDTRLDLSRAYWLVAGIAGIDPEDASIGSAAWARYVVDGDLAHEIDAREIPADWKSGYFPLDRKGPSDPTPPRTDGGEVFALNPRLAEWAFRLTRDVALPDDPGIARERARYTDHPNARKPPFVLMGDQFSAMTFWHGALLNRWANDHTRYFTQGKGNFVTSAMEESGTLQAIDYLSKIGRADKDRVLVLRTGSNYTMPPPGVTAADYLLRENEGYAGLNASVESLYRVGDRVVTELLTHWDRYGTTPPQ